jgi:heat shock protein HtpX
VTGGGSATPLVVYDRIDTNRRKTRLLLAWFAVALLPLVSGGAAFVFPLIHLMFVSVWPGALRALDPTSLLWIYVAFFLVSMLIVGLVLAATVDLFISKYGSSVILRLANARPVYADEEPDLVQVVEKLCIGAGLPLPRIHVIESAVPNAFATGLNPDDASLVVTRGLLRLLDRRELEGVIAHELSHIGNHDISLSTTLAALIGTVSLPLKMLSAPLRAALNMRSIPGVAVMMVALYWLTMFESDSLLMLWWFVSSVIFFFPLVYFPDRGPATAYWWWSVYARSLPVYGVFAAPLVALFIRHAVSRQREFLADADAVLLTRDPEGLALALVKIGAVAGTRLRVAEAAVHLYFVDPSSNSWIHVLFPSHPSLAKRVDLLARMGNGIVPSAIQAARDAGAKFQVQPATSADQDANLSLPDPPSTESLPSSQTESTPMTDDGFTRLYGIASEDGFTRLYDRPDVRAEVVALLPEDALVKLEGREGAFARITTQGGVAGYVRPAQAGATAAGAAVDHSLIPLYARPDGWSRVLAQLAESAAVTVIRADGEFVQVTTADRQTGYVSRSAPLAALKNSQQ